MSVPPAPKAPKSSTATRPDGSGRSVSTGIPTDVPSGRYRHYKGGEYEVVDIAIHSETHEQMVVYRPLYGEGRLWVRPLAMFMETVTIDGTSMPRFAPIPPR